jgi:DNA-directed RNA polymerase subunit RPC12/RpoP
VPLLTTAAHFYNAIQQESINTGRAHWESQIAHPEFQEFVDSIPDQLADSKVPCDAGKTLCSLSLTFFLTVQAWVDDTASLTCLLCVEKFTYSNRRHHCRTCGALVCDHCSSKRLTTGTSPGLGASSKNKRNSGIPVPPSPKDGSSTKKPAVKEGDRVCDGCFNKLAHECFLWQQAVQRVRRAQEKLAAEAPELLLNEASLTG